MREVLANLAGATAEDLAAVLEFIGTRGAELAVAEVSTDVVDELSEMVTARKTVLTEQGSRQAAAESETDLATRRAEALAELDGTHDPKRDNIQPPAEGEGTQPPTVEQQTADAEEEDKAKPRAKKATRELGELKAKEPQRPANGGTVTAITRVVGNIPGHTAGDVVQSDDALTAAFIAKANALNNTSTDGRQDVLRVTYEYPEDRVLSGSDAAGNQAKLRAVRETEALTAAGLCLPLEVRYDIDTVGVTDRPVKAALSGFTTERGGIQYRAPFDALAMAEGLGTWTQADDAADPLVPKTCLAVVCPGVLEASIYSTYLCLEFPNMGARFDPQWVRATTESAMVAHARFAENQLLSRLFSGSKLVQGNHVLGAVRDILQNFDKAIAYYRNRHRLDDTIPLHGIYPRWLIDLCRADLAMQMSDGSPQELFAIAKSALESWFRTRNVNPTWHLDGLAGATVNAVVIPDQFYANAAAGATIPPFPTKVDSLLYREGDWLFLDGGTLDLGLVRDSALNLRNRYQTFLETFEGVANVGIESLRVVFPVVPSGAASGTIDPRAIDSTLPVAV